MTQCHGGLEKVGHGEVDDPAFVWLSHISDVRFDHVGLFGVLFVLVVVVVVVVVVVFVPVFAAWLNVWSYLLWTRAVLGVLHACVL